MNELLKNSQFHNNRESCNNVMDFHVVTNFSIDIMHDLFEGVCRYNFGYMLPYFINQHCLSHETKLLNKIFSLRPRLQLASPNNSITFEE